MTSSGLPDGSVELIVGGMTCASCAARVERRLNLLDGVEASVNYATERAYVTETGGRHVSEIIGAIEAAGYTAAVPRQDEADAASAEAAATSRRLARRLILCSPPAMVVIVLSMIPVTQFDGWQWVALALTIPVAAWGAWPMHRSAWRSLEHGTATMDTLVSLGIVTSLLWSVHQLAFGGAGRMNMRMPFALTFGPAGTGTIYLDVTAGVTVSVLLGRYLESRAKRHSGSALTALADLAVRSVSVLRADGETREPVSALLPGDLFVTRPGEKIAVDGVIVEGNSAVDASLLTGESLPAEVGPGDHVTGATLNMSGRIVVRASRVGSDTRLSQIIRLVTEAQATKSNAQRLADRISGVFVPCVIALATATLGFWLGAGLPGQSAWSAAFAVLVVACPCAMGLATSTALLAGVGRGAQLGILVRGAQSLESAFRADVVVLDKTGTITTGTMSVLSVTAAGGWDAEEALRLAGAAEDGSEHPIGRAIARTALDKFGSLPPVRDFSSVAGSGVCAMVADQEVLVGSPRMFAERGTIVPEELGQAVAAAQDRGSTAVLVGRGGSACAVISVADAVKPTSAGAVARLREIGLRPVLMTGDNHRTALAVARQIGIPACDVFSEVPPEGKIGVVRDIQSAGVGVAVVGDGINDAAALAAADIGIAVGTGTDAAIGASDLTLVAGDPALIADAILLARATLRTIRQNLAWAFAYNIVALPLAALGYLNPLFAGVAMSASSVIVVTNGLRLRRFGKGKPEPPDVERGMLRAPVMAGQVS